jgi:hypothetical protein
MPEDTFEVLILTGRPASGKSEIIDYLLKLPAQVRRDRYHIARLDVLDDFPMLWTWYEEDHILSQVLGKPRLHTDELGYFKHIYQWDLLVERLSLEYEKRLRDEEHYFRYATMVTFCCLTLRRIVMVPLIVSDPRPVQIERSEQIALHSEFVRDDLIIKVWFPDEYTTSGRRFPVLYLLDGDFAFGLATDIVQYLIYSRLIPNLIIVSPSYGTKTDVRQGGKNNRGRDLLHSMPDWARELPGWNQSIYGGAQFMQCLLYEILPIVEANYRIDPTDRTLFSFSGGGYFLTHALFETDGIFRRMIQVDGCREDEALALEEQYAQTHQDLSIRLFVSSRTLEGCERKMVDRLNTRGYPNLAVELYYQDVADHFAAPADGLTRGLVAIFRGWETQG